MLKNMFDGMSIYVCSDSLSFFVNNILENINKKFVLVSGDSDLLNPLDSLSEYQINKLVQNTFLLKWFCQNMIIDNYPKIIQMPIGLDFHTIYNIKNFKWKLPEESDIPIEQEKILFSIRDSSVPFYERKPLIIANFSMQNDAYGERFDSLNKINKNILIYLKDFLQRSILWKEMLKYTFVLSPKGNGIDCHRTWEALVLGCIPIVRLPKFKKMLEGLPVLNVNDWSEINEELLKKTIDEFKNKDFLFEKLKLQYWINQINQYQYQNIN
jgi:hypothetical protein